MQEIRIGQGPATAAEEAAAEASEKLAKSVAQSTEAALDKMADATASTLREAGHKGAALGKQALESGGMWMSQARECVRQHPLTSVAVALGIGMLVRRLRID